MTMTVTEITPTAWPPTVMIDGSGKRWVPETALAAVERELAEAKACVNAMAGIESPAAFVAKVRDVLAVGTVEDGFDVVYILATCRDLAAMLPPEPKEV